MLSTSIRSHHPLRPTSAVAQHRVFQPQLVAKHSIFSFLGPSFWHPNKIWHCSWAAVPGEAEASFSAVWTWHNQDGGVCWRLPKFVPHSGRKACCQGDFEQKATFFCIRCGAVYLQALCGARVAHSVARPPKACQEFSLLHDRT